MAWALYRLAFDDPLQWDEQTGDPMANLGGAPVPAIRSALRHSVSLATFTTTANDTPANQLKLRRQLRSLLNNGPFKLGGLYVAWDADPEQNGWYIPDQGLFVSGADASSGLATGYFKVESFVWFLAGHMRTHRKAFWVYLKDLRTGLYPRDYLKRVLSTDFSGLSALALTPFPPGASAITLTANGQRVATASTAAGEDGGTGSVATGLLDGGRYSFEQPEASRNLGQVRMFDRRNNITAPSGGPDAAWEEFYGPDYPLYWMANGGTPDAPVLENGRVRVRYDASNSPGFRIDYWTGGAWDEQGKVCFMRRPGGGFQGYSDTLVSTAVMEYTDTRVVLEVVVAQSGDAQSNELIYITLEQGSTGPRFEIYPAPQANGANCDAGVSYTTATTDTDDSAIKIDASNVGVIAATAQGTGHTGQFANAGLGAGSFTGENQVALLRSGRSVSASFALVQAANCLCFLANEAVAYGVARNEVQFLSQNSAGYVSVQIGYVTQTSQQVMEAESLTLGSGTSLATDANASPNGGSNNTTNSTRTADAIHVSAANWCNGGGGVYRVFARVKTTASTLNIYAKTTGTTGATKTTTSGSYVWVDLGDIIAHANTLEIHCWATAAATVSVDRIEAVLMVDNNTANFAGARDLGQSALYDNRTLATLVTRS